MPGVGRVAEYGVATLGHLLRISYTVGEKVAWYVVGDVGVGLTQVNGRKTRGLGLSIRDENVGAVGIVGAGLEYFLADNLALGIDVRYIAGRRGVKIEGVPHSVDLDTGLLSLIFPVRLP